ncbi:MAG TPA: 50S ribosomal protein L4 [Bacteroidia bacterium]|nr:50S ribosomal protein L4 [Bacteroidia bacterium]
MKAEVFNINGKSTGRTVELSDNIYLAEPNDHCIYLDVKSILANKRQGTHKTKERSEVNRTKKKLYRQKGTGNARHGSMNAPIFVGGGTVFGPKPRDYSMAINKKVKDIARISALSYKAKNNSITVVENFNFEQPKTKQFVSLLSNFNLLNKKSLFIISAPNNSIYLSARNIEKTKVIPATDVNTYDILNADNIIITEDALPIIESTLLKK